MKRTMQLACLTALGVCLFLATASHAFAMQITRDAVLRDSPSFLGKPVETLNSGTSIALIREQGDWARVRARGKQGWLPVAAFRSGAVQLGPGSSRAAVGASSSEVVLAGKGFTQQTEAAHRASRPNLNYAAVDMMTAFAVPPADIEAFLRTGREGGSR